jgi:hypothetical protein
MCQPYDQDPFAVRLRVMRILHAALCLGVVFFAVVVLVIRQGGAANLPPPAVPMVSYVLAGMAALTFVMFLILPGMLESSWRKQFARPNSDGGEPGQWWGLYQTRLIIRCALLEGTAFAQLIAYMLEGQQWSLGLALGLLVALLAQFPTRSGVEGWVETQRDLARQASWQ